MRDSGALTELLLTRLKKVEVPKNYVSLRKYTIGNRSHALVFIVFSGCATLESTGLPAKAVSAS
jgi:hypothetical protein